MNDKGENKETHPHGTGTFARVRTQSESSFNSDDGSAGLPGKM